MAASFDKQRVVVFGGSSGIGLAACTQLCQLGLAELFIVGRSEEKLAKAVEELKPVTEVSHTVVHTASVDITDEDAVQKYYEGHADQSLNHVVVTVGGSALLGNLVENKRTAADVRKQMDLKFFSQLSVVLNGHPKVVDGGSFVMFSGVLSVRPGHGNTALSIANAAVEAAVRGLANDLGFARRIRINCVSPGYTDTAVYAAMGEERWQAYKKKNAEASPIGRVGSPEEVGASVIYLLSNSNTTGVVLANDSGYLIKP